MCSCSLGQQAQLLHLGDWGFAGFALAGSPGCQGIEKWAGLQAGGGRLPGGNCSLGKRGKCFLPTGGTCVNSNNVGSSQEQL